MGVVGPRLLRSSDAASGGRRNFGSIAAVYAIAATMVRARPPREMAWGCSTDWGAVANGFAFVVTTAVGVVAEMGLCCLRALRRPRQSGRWLQTQVEPPLTLSSSIDASQAGQSGGDL